MSGDLAQSVRRAGWNVLLFHYRGTWGAPGSFSQSSAIEDMAEVVRFLREPGECRKIPLGSNTAGPDRTQPRRVYCRI